MREYISPDKLIYKCFTCTKILHLTKTFKQKSKFLKHSKFFRQLPKGKFRMHKLRNYSSAYKWCPSYKNAISKSLVRAQNISYLQAVWCERAVKEDFLVKFYYWCSTTGESYYPSYLGDKSWWSWLYWSNGWKNSRRSQRGCQKFNYGFF